MESVPFNRRFQLDPTKELSRSDIERNNLIKVGLNFPVTWMTNVKVIGSLNYKRETLNLVPGVGEFQPKTYRLYHTGANFKYQINLNEDEFILGHIGGNLRSDKLQFSDFSYSVSVGWGKDLSPDKKIALGMGYTEAWGRARFSPILLYDNRINEKWDLNLLLPRHARIKYYQNHGLTFFGEARGSSATYLIDHHQILPGFTELEYRQRRAALNVGVEKQIIDWFWVGAQAGITIPLRSILVESGLRSRDHIHDFESQIDRYLKFTVFLVPPQKMFDKLKGR